MTRKFLLNFPKQLMMSKAFGFLLLFVCSSSLIGQELSSLSLDEVTVYGSRVSEGEVGVNSISIDSLILAQSQGESFAELLRKIGAGQIRSYGVSGLSTASFRGTNGSQTSVLWNGVTLNSTLNGSADISQIPVSGSDQKIRSAGTATMVTQFRVRLYLLALLVLAGFSLLVYRLYQIQVVEHEKYAARVPGS
ncbi:MAG: TonB-dependent receptor plug domain-containing protein, partial [Ekhidna sp.]|nr:TonB-dependent receptor plug domain-containing protein [Ekhidna sp.]